AAAQHAGIAALRGPQGPVRRMVEAFAERRRYFVAALNSLPGFRCATPGGAFYAFPNVAGTGFDTQAVPHRLLHGAGVATIAGTSFGAFGEGYLRFSYAASLAQLKEAMARIQGWLSENIGRAA